MVNEKTNASNFYTPIKQGILIAIFILCTVVALYAAFNVRRILLLAISGIGLGVVLAPALDFLSFRLKLPRSLSAILLLLVLLALLAGLGSLVAYLVTEDLTPLLKQLPLYLEQARQRLISYAERVPLIGDILPDSETQTHLASALNTLLQGLKIGGTAIIGILFILAIAIYISVSSDKYLRSFLSLFPAYLRPQVRDIAEKCAVTLRYWLGGQIIIMLAVGMATALALLIIGIEYWSLYGVLAGLLNFIPYLGPIVTAVAISVVTLGANPEMFLWVLGTFTLIQQVESYVLVPLVMRGTVELPPVYLLILIFIMGSWFGLLGIFLASPLFAVTRTVLIHLYIPKMDQKF